MTNVDLYEVLDVAPDASAVEIKDAYRRVVRSAHPDAGGTDALFRLVTHAYNVLSNPDSRAAYDAESRGSRSDIGTTRYRAEKHGGDPGTGEPGADWDVDADWGVDVSRSQEQDDVTEGPGARRRRFERWAVSSAADLPLKIAWSVVGSTYVFVCGVLLGFPEALRPEAAGADAFEWLTERWWLVLIIVVVYAFFAWPSENIEGGLGVWRILGAIGLLTWLPAYADMATAFDVWLYSVVFAVWVLHQCTLEFVEVVGNARYYARIARDTDEAY